MTSSAIAAGSMYLLKNCGGGRKIESATAVLLRDERREIAGLSERGDKFGRLGAVAIQRAPVFSWKFGAQRAYAGANISKFIPLSAALFHKPTLCSRQRLTSAARSGPN